MDDVVHVEENVELETKKEVDEGNTSRNTKICLRSNTALRTIVLRHRQPNLSSA